MDANCPLNQLYQFNKTCKAYPIIEETYEELTEYAKKNNFCVKNPDGTIRYKGRRYDNAVLYNMVKIDGGSFDDKIVCELGGRDGIFSSWLTQFVSKIYVSDYFEEWGKGTIHDLGSFNYWSNIWKSAAVNPDRLVGETQDITQLSYPDNMFDIVICTSVIEHIFPQKGHMGDMIAIREIARITKPGGYILLSTDATSSKSKWHSGTFYYNDVDLQDRIIGPSRCQIVGDTNFNFGDPSNTDIHNVPQVGPCSSVILALKKNFVI